LVLLAEKRQYTIGNREKKSLILARSEKKELGDRLCISLKDS